jgi:hypothetical protein
MPSDHDDSPVARERREVFHLGNAKELREAPTRLAVPASGPRRSLPRPSTTCGEVVRHASWHRPCSPRLDSKEDS